MSNSLSSTENNKSETTALNLEFQKHVVELTFPLPKEVEEVTRNTGWFGFFVTSCRVIFKATFIC